MQLMTLASFVFFTATVGLLTWWLTRRDKHDSSDGYFLGGRSLTAGFIAGSLMLTNLSTEQLVGLNGAAFDDGLCVMAWEVIAGMSLVLMALYFLPRYLKSGIATIPEFLEKRYDHRTRSITSLIFIVAYAGILLPIVLYTGATGLNEMLNVSELTGLQSDGANIWLTVWVIGVIGSVYAIFGGLRTVAVSDTINGFGLLVGGILITWFGLQAVDPDSMGGAIRKIREVHPEKFNSLGGANESVPFSTLFTGVLLLNLFYWCTNQQIIQRTFGASSLKEGQKGVLLAGGLKILAPLILVIPGIIAFYLYGRVVYDGQSREIVAITREADSVIAVAEGSAGEELLLTGSEITALAETEAEGDVEQLIGTRQTLNGTAYQIQRAVPVGTALFHGPNATLVESGPAAEDGLSVAEKDKAYGQLVRHVLPGWLVGFFAAVVVGAILSSFNSALNSTATLFSLGVYKGMMHPDASDRQTIAAGKIFGTVIALISMTVAPLLLGQDSIFGYLQKMNGLYFIPIFSVVLTGLLFRRVPPFAANIALITGFVAIAVGYFVPAADELVSAINGFHFLGAVFVGLVVLMVVLGKLHPLPEPWKQEDAGAVEMTPWPLAMPVGLGLVIIVLGIYVSLADFSVVTG